MVQFHSSGGAICPNPSFQSISQFYQVILDFSKKFSIYFLAEFETEKAAHRQIVVEVSTKFAAFQQQCDILVSNEVEILAISFNKNQR